jgi:hypothetical protein
VVEEDAVAGEEAVAFAVVDGLPEGEDLRAAVGAAGALPNISLDDAW